MQAFSLPNILVTCHVAVKIIVWQFSIILTFFTSITESGLEFYIVLWTGNFPCCVTLSLSSAVGVASITANCLFTLDYINRSPVRSPGRNAPVIWFLILALCVLFACLYRMLPHSSFFLHVFFTYLLPYLSFPLRIDPLRFQAGCRKRRPKPGFSFCVYFVL